MDLQTIAPLLGGLCCCMGSTIVLGGAAFFVWKKKQQGDPTATNALGSLSSLAQSAASAGQQAVQAGAKAAQEAADSHLSTAPPAPPVVEPVGHPEAVADDDSFGDDDDDDDDAMRNVDPADRPADVAAETGMTFVRQSGDAFLMEDPDDEERMWMYKPANGFPERPAEEWDDFWGPLPPRDVDAFCDHWADQQDAELHKTDTLDEELAKLGYATVGDWYRTYWTYIRHFGQSPGPGANLEDYDPNPFMMEHLYPARTRQHQRRAGAHAASNPELMAPVEGITVEVFATCSAAAAQGLSGDPLTALLAEHGMDLAMWQRVSAEWTDRMSKDTTHTITQIYSNAFQSAGSGQFAAAGQAATESRTGDGRGAQGEEPLPFERVCEIQGAMSAWSSTGQDVNAMLHDVFGMSAADWSNANTWWLSRLHTDIQKMQEYSSRCDHYETQYLASAGVSADEDPDADIQF